MVDRSNKITDSDGITSEENVKRCADCGTSKTPLWRSGPAGPKSLCNACGIRSRKRGRVFLGINKSLEKKTKNSTTTSSSSNSNSSGVTTTTSFSSGESGPTLHQRLISLGREVMMRKKRSTVGIRGLRRRKLGEEEQAAVLLMALSYGSVYA